VRKESIPKESVTIAVKVPDKKLPVDTASVLYEGALNWTLLDLERTQDLSDLLGQKFDEQPLLQVADSLEAAGFAIRWQSQSKPTSERVDKSADEIVRLESSREPYDWPLNPTVLAIVPHWKCERWLHRCLHSLTHQTYPLTNIVVVDDGSAVAPLSVVRDFPAVTLLASKLAQQVGPYRLAQSVISQTHYTAFLFQDADDWSVCDRLQTLLDTARLHSADIVGSQEIRVVEPQLSLQTVGYPLAVNSAMAHAPGHGLLHPTSLVTRRILDKVGGFATGLRFGADSEFLLRAHWIARIVNSSQYCYFRRKRPDSLTTARDTGLSSPARMRLTREIKENALARSQAMKTGEVLDLSPLAVKPLVTLKHLWGPTLRWR